MDKIKMPLASLSQHQDKHSVAEKDLFQSLKAVHFHTNKQIEKEETSTKSALFNLAHL